MRRPLSAGAVLRAAALGAAALLLLSGCSVSPTAASDPTSSTADSGLAALLVTDDEGSTRGGWTVSPDDGDVDGDSKDCTGADFDWPDSTVVGHAQQFLDRDQQTLFVVLKRLDADAAPNIEAVRQALAPCAPPSGERAFGAMVTPIGDDSFAYQSKGRDDGGEFWLSDTVVACGRLEVEVIGRSYTELIDQREIETDLKLMLRRVLRAGGC